MPKNEADVISQLKVGGTTYNIKDAFARTTIEAHATSISTVFTNLQSEIDRATAAETTISNNLAAETITRATKDSELEGRIENLEARGRYLSTWNATNGTTGDLPVIPSSETGTKYTYEYKAGDYYIIDTVPASGTVYMPDGSEITATRPSASSTEWTWTIGKKEYTDTTKELVVGGQFVYSGTSWTYVATAKEVSFKNISGSPFDNTALALTINNITASIATLDTNKVDKSAQIAGITINGGIETTVMQEALGLEDLAYADYAVGTATIMTIDSITMSPLTVSGNASISVEDANVTSTGKFTPVGTIAKIDYTPAGTIDSEATLADTDATITRKTVSYTPAGTISKVEITTGGSVSATLGYTTSDATVNKGWYTPTGSLDYTKFKTTETAAVCTSVDYKPAGTITVNALSQTWTDASVGYTDYTPAGSVSVSLTDNNASKLKTAGSVAQWSGATFTAASLGEASTAQFNTDAVKTTVSGEVLEFIAAATTAAVTAQGTFNGGSVDFGTFTPNVLPTFDDVTVGVESSSFTGTKMTTMMASVKFQKAEQNGATFDGTTADNKWITGAKYDKFTSIDDGAFVGTSAQINVTDVKYSKADQTVNTAFTGETSTVTPTFSGTAHDFTDFVDTVSYKKVTAVGSTFSGTPTSFNPSFTGTEGDVSVSGTYKKADGNGAFSVTVTPTVASYNQTQKSIALKVTVE